MFRTWRSHGAFWPHYGDHRSEIWTRSWHGFRLYHVLVEWVCQVQTIFCLFVWLFVCLFTFLSFSSVVPAYVSIRLLSTHWHCASTMRTTRLSGFFFVCFFFWGGVLVSSFFVIFQFLDSISWPLGLLPKTQLFRVSRRISRLASGRDHHSRVRSQLRHDARLGRRRLHAWDYHRRWSEAQTRMYVHSAGRNQVERKDEEMHHVPFCGSGN